PLRAQPGSWAWHPHVLAARRGPGITRCLRRAGALRRATAGRRATRGGCAHARVEHRHLAARLLSRTHRCWRKQVVGESAGDAVKPLCLGFLLVAFAPGFAAAQFVQQGQWTTNGPVSTFAQSGDTLYVAGEFTVVGPVTGGGAALDLATGQP